MSINEYIIVGHCFKSRARSSFSLALMYGFCKPSTTETWNKASKPSVSDR